MLLLYIGILASLKNAGSHDGDELNHGSRSAMRMHP